MIPVHPTGRGTYLVAISSDLNGQFLGISVPMFLEIAHLAPAFADLTNVGVDDVFFCELLHTRRVRSRCRAVTLTLTSTLTL